MLTLDGVGEWATTSLAVGRGNGSILREIHFPHSLGLLYSAFTYYCGFRVNSGEYKLMGLAPYGEPRFAELIREDLIDVKPDGSFRLDLDYFDYCTGLTMTNARFDALFGGPPRQPDEPLVQRHMDLAASIQQVTEDVLLALRATSRRAPAAQSVPRRRRGAQLRGQRGDPARRMLRGTLDPAGGRRRGRRPGRGAVRAPSSCCAAPRPPAKHGLDARRVSRTGVLRRTRSSAGSRRGRGFDRSTTMRSSPPRRRFAAGPRGRLVPGPHRIRAARARQSLDPRRCASPKMQSMLNLKVKFRESFRPFAPAVLREDVADWFDLDRRQPVHAAGGPGGCTAAHSPTAADEALAASPS